LHSRAPDHLEPTFFLIGQAKVGAGGTAQDEDVITPVHEVVRVDDIVRERSHVPVPRVVAPGPGLVVIALALAVFAIEYQWARRNLAAVQERARSAALKAAASRVATASAVLFGIGAIGLGVVLIFTDLL